MHHIYIYTYTYVYMYIGIHAHARAVTWCNGYRRRKWTQRPEFKFSTRLFCISQSGNIIGKDLNSMTLTPAMVKLLERQKPLTLL